MSLFDIPTTAPAAPSGLKRTPMPEWLVRQLDAAGHLDAATGATRKTRSTFCPHCRRGIMRGLTSLPTPWAVDADPTPLSADGEALVLLAGLETYELRWVFDHYELERRTPFLLRHAPAGTAKGVDVLARHRCGKPAAWPTAATNLSVHRRADRTGDTADSDDPPF